MAKWAWAARNDCMAGPAPQTGPKLNIGINWLGMPYQGRIYRERQVARLAWHVIEDGFFDGLQLGLDLV